MKATVKNLDKALKACAKAHKVDYKWWKEDGQITLHADSIPVIADVVMIVESFYGSANGIVETNFGYTTVWLYNDMDTENDVNESLMYMALPFGTKIKS